jgi:hypothetical protein
MGDGRGIGAALAGYTAGPIHLTHDTINSYKTNPYAISHSLVGNFSGHAFFLTFLGVYAGLSAIDIAFILSMFLFFGFFLGKRQLEMGKDSEQE